MVGQQAASMSFVSMLLYGIGLKVRLTTWLIGLAIVKNDGAYFCPRVIVNAVIPIKTPK